METLLAMIGRDGVLRLVRDGKDGMPEEIAAMAIPDNRTPGEILGMVKALAEFTTPPPKAKPKPEPKVVAKVKEKQRQKPAPVSWLDSTELVRWIDQHGPLTKVEIGAKYLAELGQDDTPLNRKRIASRVGNLGRSGYLVGDDEGRWSTTELGRAGVPYPGQRVDRDA